MIKILLDKYTVENFQQKDLKTIFKIRQEISRQDGIDPQSTLETTPSRKNFEKSLEAKNTNPLKDIFVIKKDGEAVGYCQAGYWSEEGDIKVYIHHIFLLKKHRLPKLLQGVLSFIEDHLKSISTQHVSKNKYFATNTSESENEKLSLLQINGYKNVWQMVEMKFNNFTKLPELTIPESFKLKPVIKSDYKDIYLANKEVYSGKWGSKPVSDDEFNQFLEDFDTLNTVWTVAWRGSEVAGFVISIIKNDYTVIDEVSVRKQFRKQGLGKYLLVENIKQAHKKGAKTIRLHTDLKDQGNGLTLYNKLGFTSIKEHFRLRKPF
ncbi:MAG: GNAT family N-acetyltransferase [Candidatus Beckwithbacteria bacterium]